MKRYDEIQSCGVFRAKGGKAALNQHTTSNTSSADDYSSAKPPLTQPDNSQPSKATRKRSEGALSHTPKPKKKSQKDLGEDTTPDKLAPPSTPKKSSPTSGTPSSPVDIVRKPTVALSPLAQNMKTRGRPKKTGTPKVCKGPSDAQKTFAGRRPTESDALWTDKVDKYWPSPTKKRN